MNARIGLPAPPRRPRGEVHPAQHPQPSLEMLAWGLLYGGLLSLLGWGLLLRWLLL
jgi:hypothetical protein